MELQSWFNEQQTRRRVLKQLGMLTGLSLSLDACISLPGTGNPQPSHSAIKSHTSERINYVLVACQENRTFDEYFGHYPRAGKYGIPAGYSLPDGKGGTVTPYHFPKSTSSDISHSWQAIHKEWNKGKIDGFVTTDGQNAIGYYDGSDLPYYYALAKAFTLCGNYFGSMLGPTLPNRLYLWTGTSGGITAEKIQPGNLDWPAIVDLLDAHKVTWKCYNLGLGLGSTPELEFFNMLPFFKRWKGDSRLNFKEQDYYNDLKAGTLPQVSFLISEALSSEHPPLNIQSGQKKMAQVINALIQSPVWKSSVLFFTYDEGGGYFDHVPPPQLDAYGLGFRVPTLVVSPWAKRGYVSGRLYEHNSILKFIERRFGLPTLASVNHQFDASTPPENNDAAAGKAMGPPAPPRDGFKRLGDFYEVFDFSQDPNYYPSLPSV